MPSYFLVINKDTPIEVKDNVIFVAGEGLYQIEDKGKRDDRFELLKWFRVCSEIQGRPITIEWGATYRERVSHYLNQRLPTYEVSIDDNWFVLDMEHKDKYIRRFKALIKDIDGEIK